MTFHKIALAIVLCVYGFGALVAKADELTKPELSIVVGLAIEEIDGKPRPELAAKYKPTILVDKSLQGITDISAFGVPVTVKKRDDIRLEQLAWFTAISLKEQGVNKAVLTYVRPSSGHFGNLLILKSENAWRIEKHEKSHSSSGARNFYGKLYDGVPCRDGTEMSERWNIYSEMMKDIMAGKKPDTSKPVGKTCPGPDFPEVAQYRKNTQ